MGDVLEPGMKVEAINVGVWPYRSETPLTVGAIYTVRDLVDFGEHGGPCIRVVEIVNPPRKYSTGYCECAYGVENFRPLRNRSTDISLFREIVDREFKKHRVDA